MWKLEKIRVWQPTKVRNKKRGGRWSKDEGQSRALRDISGHLSCHLKNSELEPKFQKYKGRVVPRGDIVKDDPGSYAVFTEQGSSASLMTAAKVMAVRTRLLCCDGQAADAVSADTLVKMEAAPSLLKIPNQNVQIFGYVYHDTNRQNRGPAWKTQSFLSGDICTVILGQGC